MIEFLCYVWFIGFSVLGKLLSSATKGIGAWCVLGVSIYVLGWTEMGFASLVGYAVLLSLALAFVLGLVECSNAKWARWLPRWWSR